MPASRSAYQRLTLPVCQRTSHSQVGGDDAVLVVTRSRHADLVALASWRPATSDSSTPATIGEIEPHHDAPHVAVMQGRRAWRSSRARGTGRDAAVSPRANVHPTCPTSSRHRLARGRSWSADSASIGPAVDRITTPSRSRDRSRCESTLRGIPGRRRGCRRIDSAPTIRLRMMIGVQRSARTSDAKAIGQYWP